MENYKIVDESCADLRAIARGALRGNWKKAIIITIVYFLLFQGVASILAYLFPVTLLQSEAGNVTISYAELLYTLFTSGAFTYGYVAFSLSFFRKQEAGITKLFDGFEHIIKLLGLTIVMGIFIALWSLLLIIPGIVAGYKYSQAYNILYDHPEYGILKCISESKKMMTGNKAKLFMLTLSYIGWIIIASIPTVVLSMVLGAQELANPDIFAVVAQNIALIFMSPAALYIMMGEMAFYEIANGNLVKEVLEVSPLTSDPIVNLVEDVKSEKAKESDESDGVNLDK
ncbi:MAG: DUF975 family protein [Eubacteriales bacterium]